MHENETEKHQKEVQNVQDLKEVQQYYHNL